MVLGTEKDIIMSLSDLIDIQDVRHYCVSSWTLRN